MGGLPLPPKRKTQLSGEIIFPQKIMSDFMRVEIKLLEAFRRNETAKEKGTYKIPPFKLEKKKPWKKVVELNETKRAC